MLLVDHRVVIQYSRMSMALCLGCVAVSASYQQYHKLRSLLRLGRLEASCTLRISRLPCLSSTACKLFSVVRQTVGHSQTFQDRPGHLSQHGKSRKGLCRASPMGARCRLLLYSTTVILVNLHFGCSCGKLLTYVGSCRISMPGISHGVSPRGHLHFNRSLVLA